ncbi:MAG: hypothetical protein H7263_03165 [Candidatus Sericytochromatia bacterium]|nr:hypothetical protein [Candidatus Sericytochromatia bacterium]
MQDENQFEITKALMGVVVCTILSFIGADLSSIALASRHLTYNQSIFPGLIFGVLFGGLIVEIFMRKIASQKNYL